VTSQYPEEMRKRLTPSGPVMQGNIAPANLAPPPWRIEIPSADGSTMLLILREEDGRLIAEGDESRWSDAAKRFVGVMMQWAGGHSINWKDEARRAAG